MNRSVLAAALALSAPLSGCIFGPPRIEDLETRQTTRIARSELADHLEVGDTAIVTTTWREKYTFRIYRVGKDSFSGVSSNDKKYKVMYADVRHAVVERRKAGAELTVEFLVCGSLGICE